MPDQPGTIYSIITDPEVTQTAISVFSKMPARDQSTVGAYRRLMAERLFSGMLSDRLDEIAQQPNAPFLAAQTSRGIFVRTAGGDVAERARRAGRHRARAHGAVHRDRPRGAVRFPATELDRQARGLQQVLENATVEKNKSPSGPLADEFIRNFLTANRFRASCETR